uniref:Uncharacterized protein n=1 Tax=Romanomermis culicivorax TaxID=13658 RepID=A0A915IVJ7_ROMCU
MDSSFTVCDISSNFWESWLRIMILSAPAKHPVAKLCGDNALKDKSFFEAVFASVFPNDGVITYNQCCKDSDASNINISNGGNDYLNQSSLFSVQSHAVSF